MNYSKFISWVSIPLNWDFTVLESNVKLWEIMFGYLRGPPPFLSSVLKVDRRAWDVPYCLLILVLWEGQKSPPLKTILSLDVLSIFSCVSIYADGTCPQSSNKQFGAKNGNYLKQETTISQRLKSLLSETCAL